MKTIPNWLGDPIEIASSKGGVMAVTNYLDNLIIPKGLIWPPPEIVQKLYQSRQVRAFEGSDLETVTHRLGYYTDLQSLHSEDAIIWSVFGTLKYSSPIMQSKYYIQLLNILRIPVKKSKYMSIDLWRLTAHPDTLVPGGPEIDAVLQTAETVLFCEAKWLSKVTANQGKTGDQDQFQLRCKYFTEYGRRIYGTGKRFIVLGVGLEGGLVTEIESEDLYVRAISWDVVCGLSSHPYQGELRKYLEWKKEHSKGEQRSTIC